MKTIQRLVQKIIKYRQASVNTIFTEKIIGYEWLLFGKYKIARTSKTV
jgi:hypothetical protein